MCHSDQNKLLIHISNMKRRPTNTPRVNSSTACRAVFMVLSRDRGIPLSSVMNPILGGALPVEEAILAVGLFGMSPQNRALARLGIYNFEDGGPTFKYAINFDTVEGFPIFQPQRGARRFIAESDMAAVSWMQGVLFDHQVTPGNYYLKLDRPNAVGVPDLDEKRDLELLRARMPTRSTFGAERRLDSAMEMFDEYIERDETASANLMPEPPRYKALFSPDQIPAHAIRDGSPSALPLLPVNVPAKPFVSFAIKRFSRALRSSSGDFHEVKGSFVRAFGVADSLLRKPTRRQMLDGLMERNITTLQQMALGHIKTLDKKVLGDIPSTMAELNLAIEALRTYYTHRNEDRSVRLYTPDEAADETMRGKIATLLSKPMFNMVHSIPVQVIKDLWSTGEYPFYGDELYRPLKN